LSQVTITLELVGPRAGSTCQLAGYQFVRGVAKIRGTAAQVDGASRYLRTCYNAQIVGTDEHLAAVAAWEAANGKRQVPTGAGSRPAEPVPGGVRPEGIGPAAPTAARLDGPAGAAPRTTGLVSDGDRQGGADQGSEVTLQDVLAQLDHADEEYWTKSGRPSVDAVSALLGRGVTRAEIDAAAPALVRKEQD
jgi:hypothetical protein